MLPATARVRRRDDFRLALRGRRAGGRGLLVHAGTSPDRLGSPARAGVIAGRVVGPAVVRNRVKRRIRHLLPPLLASAPHGAVLVVRALPASAAMTSPELRQSLASCLHRLQVDA